MGLTGRREIVRGITRDLLAFQQEKLALAQKILRQGAYAGYRSTHETLEAAETRTGQERELMGGGHPGRIRSGQLVNDLGFYASPAVGAEEGAWFGWPIEQESYDYAAAQDAGAYGARFVDEERGYIGGRPAEPRIPPAGALWEGALRARETIRELLAEAGFKRGGLS